MDDEMICTCGVDGLREVIDRRYRIMLALGVSSPRELHEAIILSLAFEYGVDCDFGLDMWFGASFESKLLPNGGFDIATDELADALAYAWEKLFGLHGRRSEARGDGDMSDYTFARGLTEACFERFVRVKSATVEHHKLHPNEKGEPSYNHHCSDCRKLLGQGVDAHVLLDTIWDSTKSTEAAVNAYFEARDRWRKKREGKEGAER